MTVGAVRVAGCKIEYTDACRAARPMSGGRLLEAYGDISPRLMTNARPRVQNSAYTPTLFFCVTPRCDDLSVSVTDFHRE